MTLASRVTVYDGTTTVNVAGDATLSVRIGTQSAGGATNLRMADGDIVRQVAWEKKRVTLTCSGWKPPGLDAIDWSEQITLTVPTPNSTVQYIGYCDEPVDTRTAAAEIDCEWVLTLDEG